MNKPHVLIVEDDVTLGNTLKIIIGEKYNTEWLTTLQEAIQRMKNRNSIEVVILDLNLSDSQGLETVKILYKNHPSIPFVVISGYPDLRTLAIHYGAKDFQEKPVTIERLISMIDSLISIKQETKPLNLIVDELKSKIQQIKGDKI